MDATLCTLIILRPTMTESYHISDNDDFDECPYQELLRSNFGKVFLQQNSFEVIQRIKQSGKPSSNLLLVDLDVYLGSNNNETATANAAAIANKKPVTLNLITTRHNHIVRYVKDIVREIKAGLLPTQIPPIIVCSEDDSPDLMLDCINAGATDYILKPLYPNVIKTLFLKLHRHTPGSNSNNVPQTHTPLPTPPHVLLPQQQSLPSSPTTVCRTLCDRINDMNSKETYLSQILLDSFVPKAKAETVINLKKKRDRISEKRSKELEARVCGWDFSPFELNQQELIHCVYLIFDKVLSLPELAYLSIDRDQFQKFLLELASVYHAENPYHNFAHAVDVLQCLFYVLCQLDILPFKVATGTTNVNRKHHSSASSGVKQPRDVLRSEDVFALLIAAIGHDAAHPGVNNMFLINSTNPLATLYNDRSVLESLHSMTLFQLLNKHQILPHIGDTKSERYRNFRKIVVSSILATDMSLHLDYVAQIREQAHRFRTNHLKEQDDLEQERVSLCAALIKCADISNVARPFHLSRQWAELLVEEFVCQGDLEKELHLPVLPMNDRDKVILEESQIGFIRFVALGLFENFKEICGEAFSFTIHHMQANLKQWEERKSLSNGLQHDSGVSNLNMEEEDNDTASFATDIVEDDTSSQKQRQTPLQRQEKGENGGSSNTSGATQMITAETGSKRASDSMEKADVKRIFSERTRSKRRTSSTSSASFYSLQQQPASKPSSSKYESDKEDAMLEKKADCLYSSTLLPSSKSSLQFYVKEVATAADSSSLVEPAIERQQQRRRIHDDSPAYCQCCIQ